MGLFKLTKQDKDYQALQDMLSPKEDQGEETTTTGILSKPDTKKEEDEESTFLSFFGNVFDRSKSQAEEISRMMQEEAERSALEVRLSRQTAGITRSLPTETANKRYNESALSGPMKLAPRALEEPVPVDVEELETPKESMDNERQSAINRMLDSIFTSDSDTTVVTDDADGGAAPSGKGLMAKPLTAEQRNAVSSMQVVTTDYTLSSEELIEQSKELFPNNPTAAAAFIATVNAEAAGGKDMTENGYSKSGAIKKFVNPYKNEDGTLGPKMTARKKAIQNSKSSDEIFEIVYGSGYTGNSRLGNTEPGDGLRYIGRGPIQLTGKYNYEKYGKLAGYDIVSNPELMSSNQQVSLAVTKAYLEDKGLEDVKTARDLYAVIGHSGGMGEANKRWRNAKKLHKKLFGFDLGTGSSLRPRSRPNTIMASN
jgi:predicted chitinase